MAADFIHRPVLMREVLEGLAVRADGIYVDGTFGRGGHSDAILAQLGRDGSLYAMDKDPEAIAAAQAQFGRDARFHIKRGSFAMLGAMAQEAGIAGKVDGVLLDLGVSSPQLDDPRRGFSFLGDGPLDMRMDPDQGISAADWVNQSSEDEIRRVLKEFGEERFAKRIARAIVAARQESPITRTGQLAELIAAAVPTREPGKHPATRSFQAIRIRINHELEELEAGLQQAVDILAPHGRLAVISFHSLEDRMVKRFMRREHKGEELPLDLPVMGETHGRLRLIGKARRPSEEEVRANPRARSSVLRIAERRA